MSVRNLKRNIILKIELANEEAWATTLGLAKDSAASDIRAAILAEIERSDLMEFNDDGTPKYRLFVKTPHSPETMDAGQVPIDDFFHAAMGTSVETFAREMKNSFSNPLCIVLRDWKQDDLDDDDNPRDECLGGSGTVYRMRGVLASAFREKLRSWFNLHQKRIIVTEESKNIERQKAVIDSWTGSEPDLLRRAFTMSGFGMICNEFIRFIGLYSNDFQKLAEVIPKYRILSRASIPSTTVDVTDLSRLSLLLQSARNQDEQGRSQLIRVLLGDEKHLNIVQSVSTDGDRVESSGDNEAEHPQQSQTGPNLRVPTDVILRTAFENILITIVAFRHNQALMPESTLVSLLWSRIFRAALIDPSFNILSDGTEFEIHSMLNASIDVKLYADYVAWLTSQTGNILPIFFVESAAEFLSTSYQEKGHFHKDFRKLALSMLVSLLGFVGIFRNHKQLLQQLRVYGAFTAGTQIQFCVAFPVYCSGSLSVIFDTRPEWRFDLCVQSLVEPDEAFRVDGADLSAFNLLDVPFPDVGSEVLSEDRWQCDDLLASLNQTIALDPSSPAKPDKYPDCCHITDIQSLNDQVLNIMAFFQDVQKTARTMSDGLSNDRLGPPIPLPSEFQSAFSRGATRNNRVSPQKTSTSQKTSSRRTITNSGKQIFMGVSVTEVVRKNKTATSVFSSSSLDNAENQYRAIVKPSSDSKSSECPILCRLIGQRNIVQLAHWESFDCLPAYGMVQEDLIPCPIELKGRGCAALMSTRSALLLDAMSALNSLCLFKIIHRDFSVNNLMYSLRDRCWKLIDFNLAVDADENGLFVCDEKTACGTKQHMAPELLHPDRYVLFNIHLTSSNDEKRWYSGQSRSDTVSLKRHDSAINVQDEDVVGSKRLREEPIPSKIVYSHASDLFAAARCVQHHPFQYYMEFMTSFEEEQDPVAIRVFNQQQQLLAECALNEDPSQRYHPKALYDNLLDMHAELYHHFHELAPGYQRSLYDHLVMFRTIS